MKTHIFVFEGTSVSRKMWTACRRQLVVGKEHSAIGRGSILDGTNRADAVTCLTCRYAYGLPERTFQEVWDEKTGGSSPITLEQIRHGWDLALLEVARKSQGYRRMESEPAQNVCEHGDHPAPARARFCSLDCELHEFGHTRSCPRCDPKDSPVAVQSTEEGGKDR